MLFDLERLRHGDQRQQEPHRVLDAEHHENAVRREEQQRVQDVRCRASDENGQGHDAGTFVVLGVARVVAVQDRLSVERQRNGIVNGHPLQTARLGHVREQHGYRSENDENDDVTEGNVLETDAARVQERRRQSAKVDERQMLHFGRTENGEQNEARTAGHV